MKTFAAALLALVYVTGNAMADDLTKSKVFSFAAAPSRALPNGGVSHDLVLGTLKSGEAVKVHESQQPQGAKPNPSHAIAHSEFIIVTAGTLAFLHDGVTETAGPGDVIYVAYGTDHQIRNIGQSEAKYAIVSIGGDIKPK
jgi:quercetin dioxygenase-like cupin family protein